MTIEADPSLLACPIEGPAEPQDELAERVSRLSAQTCAALDEVVVAAEELDEDTAEGPVKLRHLVHRVFENSVMEFFTEPPTSMQLPDHLMDRVLPLPGAIPLPTARDDLDLSLIDALEARRSERSFGKEPMALEDLATYLHWAVGVRGYDAGYGVGNMPLFHFPSIGGLAGVEFEVFAHRVEGLEPGRYRYDPVGHALFPVDLGDFRAGIESVTFESPWLFFAPVVIACVHDQHRTSWKYHTRGYRFTHIDLGGAVQNLYLVATALGWSSCAVAGFFDKEASELLGLDRRERFMSLFFAVGPPPRPVFARGG